MEQSIQFQVVAWWSAGRTGIAKSNSAPNAIQFTAPPAFGGLQGRWTPEDLLLCSVASCFTTTFQAVADYSKLDFTDLEVEVEGLVSKVSSGYAFSEIFLRPKLTIPDAKQQARALELLKKAKGLCLISRALSVTEQFEPAVEVGFLTPVE